MRAVFIRGKKKKKYKHKLSILCFRFAVCLRVYVFRSCSLYDRWTRNIYLLVPVNIRSQYSLFLLQREMS